MTEPKRRRGRPKTPAGPKPKRNIRVGKVWDDAETLAAAQDTTMTDLVTTLLQKWVNEQNTPRTTYADRKPYVTVADLNDLQGPTTGTVDLPPHIDWSGSPRRDLNNDGELIAMYQTVLAEAATPEDLTAWIDGDTLRRLWSNLWLPPVIRAMWEAAHPQLADTPKEQ